MPDLFHLPNVTIGADPEIFVGKANEIVSGHTLPFGTKEKPMVTKHGHVQIDGMALEVNVKLSENKVMFVRNCADVIGDLERLVKSCDPEMYLVCRPAARFTEKYLETIPESAKELGCNPDWNAYEMRENERPDAATTLRTAGGHVHIGWGSGFNCDSLEHIGTCAEIVKQLDYTIGLHSLEFDRDKERRELYGMAGSFRPKPYGVEYRVLSPMWLLNIKHQGMIWDGVMKALRMLNQGRVLDEEFEGLARECINHSKYEWRSEFPELVKALV